MAVGVLADARTGKNGRHLLVGLLRQSVFGRLAGYQDVNDADWLCRDPAMRWVVGDRAIQGAAASASRRGGSRQRISPVAPICLGGGSTVCTVDDRQGLSCSTWIRAGARRICSSTRKRLRRGRPPRDSGAGGRPYRGAVKRRYFRRDAVFADPRLRGVAAAAATCQGSSPSHPESASARPHSAGFGRKRQNEFTRSALRLGPNLPPRWCVRTLLAITRT
jgi:hypothetical protein